MTQTVKSFNLGSINVLLTDDGAWFHVVTVAGAKSFYGKYSAFEDADAVWTDQIQTFTCSEDN